MQINNKEKSSGQKIGNTITFTMPATSAKSHFMPTQHRMPSGARLLCLEGVKSENEESKRICSKEIRLTK